MSSPKPHCLQPFLSLRDGAFRLGDRIVFEHTTWVFQRHEQWAIIGANGSGKSLLADAVRGRLPLVKRLFSTLAGLKAGRGVPTAPRGAAGVRSVRNWTISDGAEGTPRPTHDRLGQYALSSAVPNDEIPRPNQARLELVRLRNVTVRYGKTVILTNVNWTVRAGESWALLGPNGSGKTTLLSLILGDNPQVYTNDVVVIGRQRGGGESVWDIKRHIGWVSPELHTHFNGSATCFEVVASGFHDTVGLFQPPTARQRTAARRWLARFQLLTFAHQPLYSLSAGLQRMVLLARALVKHPRLLILDEPCQGLDGAHRNLFIQTVDALIRAGAVTAIYVTHRHDEIPPSIKHVLRLRKESTAFRLYL